MTVGAFTLWGYPPRDLPDPTKRIRIEGGTYAECAAELRYRRRLGWVRLAVLPAGAPGNPKPTALDHAAAVERALQDGACACTRNPARPHTECVAQAVHETRPKKEQP